ncbi:MULTISPECIES: DivIVA domain-containing protein [Aneurinibacillus]|uniref:Cell division initiation protein n=1 Tax=Aneurinibacillus thermoaerophilus TaxID=143495 RepID=A0A1G7W9S2_ANETH|nr:MULTISPECIES: DivIVA domain-containing protein [Aneurinibacillus]AMA72589.1 cell division protein DivIVA [Aneurinibacillus sp. XH2]MED0674703.1 DivIVA domain-containing protein [Aneurinibacillus thermoaerophilus]MED0680186.1 DivIVA domain-containing protein [Aneurinibacillus thermoaerophilus]MED0736865.1 DivIVA domain-containing protein [Aneurinibacillus thermoaerophilus]MED0756706.1 DivIVA domain-containing protein [Aneurinibacillus thermoaerophilus]
MSLTPLDIHNKEFSRVFRGYDEDQVNEFLDQIIKEFDILLKEKRQLEERVATLNERLSQFSNIEETLKKSLVMAQEAADELKANARKEAQLIIKEAEKNADRLINEALAKSRKLVSEIDELKRRASVYRMRFRSILEAQLEMLDNGDWEDFEKIEEDLAKNMTE